MAKAGGGAGRGGGRRTPSGRSLRAETTPTLVRTWRDFMSQRSRARGQSLQDLTRAVTRLEKELGRRGWFST